MSGSEIDLDIRKTKEELDAERHFLGSTVRLSDGTEGLVFSRGTKNEAGLFLYNCHLCGVPNLAGERCLRTHVTGKKHQSKFAQTVIDAFAFRTSLTQKPKIPMNIAPGEPVPPGFENEVKPMAEIQAKLDSYRETALIGVEYTCEILEIDTSYCCLLCDKWEDPNSIFAHWTSYNHRLKYLEKHFSGVIRELVPYRYNPESRNIMPKVVQKVAEAIEDHHGRLSPSVYDSNEFRKNRNKIYQEMLNEKHFDEKNGPNFINIVDKRKIDEMIKTSKGSISISIESNKRRNLSPPNFKRSDLSNIRRGRDSLDSISSESDSELTLGGNKSDRQKRRKQSQSPIGRIRSRVKRSPPFEEEYNTVRKVTLPTPKELSKQASEIAQERYKWEKYRCLVDIAVKGLEKTLKDHEKNPEKHPLYPEEWKKFWNRRYKELQTEKKDPNKHDYKPEWIVFWTKRMKELHEEEIERKKCEIRKKLSLPDDAEEKTDQLKQQYIVKAPKTASTKGRSLNRESPQVIDISDDEESISSPPKSKRSRRSNTKSMSPFSDDELLEEKRRDQHRIREIEVDFDRDREKEWERDRERIGKPYPSRDYYRYPSGPSSKYPPGYYAHSYGSYRTMDPYSYPKYEPVKEKEIDDDNEPLTVVAVLRLLTALEDHLGSLGPKVVDLLAKALALEKVKANSSDDMLLNEDTSVFFETVKEKLKGQLIADVLDSHKVKAVKKAIQKIAAVIHQVNDKTAKKLKDGENTENEKSSEKNASELPFDRKLVVSKLAAALVMQQKMDVSTEEMDKLIHSFVLMVKLSKSRKKLVFVKDILIELGVLPPDPVIIESQNIEQPKLIQQQSEYQNISEENVINETTNSGNNEEEQEDEITSATGALDSLTDSDLQTLLQNFKHLSSEEQHHLIAHLKKLEGTDPVRVEKLRKYVNVTDTSKEDKSKSSPSQKITSKSSTNNENDNSTIGQKSSLNIDDEEDEDDDYNFEDVVKIVKSQKNEGRHSVSCSTSSTDNNTKNKNNRTDSSLIRDDEVSNMSRASNSSASVNISLSDTQNLITNLMGSLQKANANFSQLNSTNSVSELNSIPTISNRNATQMNTSYYMQSQQQQQQQQQQHHPPQSQGMFAQQSQQHNPPTSSFNFLNSLSNPFPPPTNGGHVNTFNNFQNQFPNFQMSNFNPIPTSSGTTTATREDTLQSNPPQVLQGFIAQQQTYRNQRTGQF